MFHAVSLIVTQFKIFLCWCFRFRDSFLWMVEWSASLNVTCSLEKIELNSNIKKYLEDLICRFLKYYIIYFGTYFCCFASGTYTAGIFWNHNPNRYWSRSRWIASNIVVVEDYHDIPKIVHPCSSCNFQYNMYDRHLSIVYHTHR